MKKTMTKAILILCLLCVPVLMTACSASTADGGKTETSATADETAGPAEELNTADLAAEPTADSTAEPISDPTAAPLNIDLDLSWLSGTVVYSQVYNIMYDPEAYLGKVIRMAGYYTVYENTETGAIYHACVIPDATACCAQGFEFVWAGDHVWPDDYPEEYTDIQVTGRLETYEEDGTIWLHLVDSEVLWEEEPLG